MNRVASALILCASVALVGCQDAKNGENSADPSAKGTPAEFEGLTLVTLKVPNMT